MYSENPVCNAPHVSYWVWLAKALSAAVFFTNAIIAFVNFLQARNQSSAIGSTIVNLVVSMMAGISALLDVGWHWGGVCEDAFGYAY